MVSDPCEEIKSGILALVQHQVEQDCSDTLVRQELHRLGSGRGYGRTVAEVVQVDPELLSHRRFVLDDQNGRTEDVGRSVNLQAGWQWRQPHLTAAVIGIGVLFATWVFQGPILHNS
jgi:hypothetical protein